MNYKQIYETTVPERNKRGRLKRIRREEAEKRGIKEMMHGRKS